MKAIILAAGLSKRLYPLTNKIPKCLIKIGRKSLLEYAMENFERSGLEEVVIITGHGAKKVENSLDSNLYKMRIRYIFNPEYARKDNIYSLWHVRNMLKGGFILLNSDVFCDPQIIEKAVNAEKSDFIIIDNNKPLGKEEMKVKVKDGIIKKISKEIDPEDADGEYIGIARFSREGSLILSKILSKFIKEGKTNLFYESAFQKMTNCYNILVLSTGNLPWIEIDDFEDLQKAKDLVLPKILKRGELGTFIKNC